MDDPFRGMEEPAHEQIVPAKERTPHSTAGTIRAQAGTLCSKEWTSHSREWMIHSLESKSHSRRWPIRSRPAFLWQARADLLQRVGCVRDARHMPWRRKKALRAAGEQAASGTRAAHGAPRPNGL